MEAIDGLLDESLTLSRQLTGPMGQADRLNAAGYLQSNWADTVANLKRFTEMCDEYLAGRFSALVNKQYNAAEYEEP